MSPSCKTAWSTASASLRICPPTGWCPSWWIFPASALPPVSSASRECVAVGRAEGAVRDDAIPDTVVQGYRNAPPDSVNSIHADRAAGRPMEVNARNGVIVRLGRTHRIPTPCNQVAVALLEAMVGAKS